MSEDLAIDLQVLDHQGKIDMTDATNSAVVGGHAEAFVTSSPGVMDKRADPAEVAFYEDAKNGLWPSRFLPAYYGHATRDGADFVSLQDLTHGFKQPCILDLKMGTQTYLEGERNTGKRLGMAMVDHLTGSKAIGVRLVGLKVYHPHAHKVFKADKQAGMSIGADHTMAEVLAFFLSDGARIRAELVEAFYRRLKLLLAHFESQSRYRFIGSSLLWVYDGADAESARRHRLKLAGTHILSELRSPRFGRTKSGKTSSGVEVQRETDLGDEDGVQGKRTELAKSDESDKPTDKPTDRPTDKPNDKPDDKPDDKPTEAAKKSVQMADLVVAVDGTQMKTLPLVRLRMIDFAKTCRVDGGGDMCQQPAAQGHTKVARTQQEEAGADAGYTHGLQSLLTALETLRDSKWALWPEPEH